MKKLVGIALGALLIAGCSTSNEVASNKLFQKRKYQKGWHVNASPRFDKNSVRTEEEIVEAREVFVETEKEEKVLVASQSIGASKNETIEFSEELEEELNVSFFQKFQSENTENTTNLDLPSTALEIEPIELNEVEIEPSNQQISPSNTESNSTDDDMLLLLYLCAIFIPFVAVGIATDWELDKVLIAVLLSFLCWIPGVIYAFITIRDYY
jgi:uncharacterized membrane protein YqaE (UPF0057 family)